MASKVLLTAFEPYERWPKNSSWLALIALTRDFEDANIDLITRRYPVDLSEMSERLRQDLQADFDLAVHLGQSPGSSVIKLESVGLNVRTDHSPLLEGAPEAYRSPLPLPSMATQLIEAGIPAEVSHHAGTYLCNASLYLSQHYSHSFGFQTKSVFIHLPLATEQVADGIRTGRCGAMASMDPGVCATAIAHVIRMACNG
ncbi:MAG: pyroglutamyl-peptidase I [Planctomycetota bacterium]